MSKPRVYLAGPISGLTYDGATSWREEAADELSWAGILALSPMRGKEYLQGIGKIGGTPEESYMENVISTPPAIVGRDRNDTQKSDLVLMYLLGAEKVSIGTMIEAGWADAARVPLVIVMEKGNIHWHCMLNQIASYIVPTLNDGIDVVKLFLQGRGR